MRKSALTVITLALLACFTHGNQVSESQLQYIEKYKNQKTVPAPADMLLNTENEPELTDGFNPLFNGEDLNGWTTKGGTHTFEAKEGTIVGTCVPGSPNAFLTTDAEYADFIFTCEMKWLVDGNSGVMIRARARTDKDDKVKVYGPQCEMEGFKNGRGWSSGIYGEGIGGWLYPLWLDAHQEVRESLRKDDWNRLTIKAEGGTIKTWLNGLPASHWITDEYMKGFFGLQIHAGGQGTVLWRNIKLKELQ